MTKLLPLSLALFLFACEEPRQQRPPRIPDEPESSSLKSGSDIQEQEEEPGVTPVDAKEPSAAEKKLACCKQCVKGASNDRTGDSPDKIPCADFTADLEDRCRKYFVKNPMNASEAKTCVAALDESAPAEPVPSGSAAAPPSASAPPGGKAPPGKAPPAPAPKAPAPKAPPSK